ncbi:MAG: guanitoxin biosynthesis heme-dependent pre-guanitoxin N-hydroxylase GntA [Daejeonella sp.]
MLKVNSDTVRDEFLSFIENRDFPCVAAKAAMSKQNIQTFIAGHMACPSDNAEIIKFLYEFVDQYRTSEQFYHSAAIIFPTTEIFSEAMFDGFLWPKLQALSDLDAENYTYDERVASDIQSSNFSFSIKQEAFYVVGLHPQSSRTARQFKYATLVFNPHDQFEALRENGKYDNIKNAIRKRDVALSGSVNPMLEDFGETSEVFQYSGRNYDKNWECPLKLKHAGTTDYSAS